MSDDKLRAAIVAEIERQASAEKAYYRPAQHEPPFGWETAIDGPWRGDVVFYDGKIDVPALCRAIRAINWQPPETAPKDGKPFLITTAGPEVRSACGLPNASASRTTFSSRPSRRCGHT